MSRTDRGAALILSLVLAQVLVLLAIGGSVVGRLVTERARVGAVSDLAALAAAERPDDPCAAADAVASVNGMAVVACARDGPDVVITVGADVPPDLLPLLGLLGRSDAVIEVSARAGWP